MNRYLFFFIIVLFIGCDKTDYKSLEKTNKKGQMSS